MVRPEKDRSWSRSLAVGVLCVSVILATGTVHAQPTEGDGQKDAAVTLYQLAVNDFQQGNYEEALRKLEEVYRLDPNPIILYNIGRSYEELGRLADAADVFQKAVSDDSLPTNLQAEIGRRLPKVLPALKVREAKSIGARTVAIGINQGADRALDAYVASQRPEETVEEPVLLQEDPLFWTGVGVEALGLGLLAGAVAIDLGLEDSIDELKKNETRLDSARTLSLQDDIERDQTLALIFYVAGGVLTAAGGVLLYSTIDSSLGGEETPPPAGTAGFHVNPWVGGDTVGVQLGGRLPWP